MGNAVTEQNDLSDFKAAIATPSAKDVADYIAELSDQLARMATANQLALLTALLQLTSVEAKRISASPDSHVATNRAGLSKALI